MCISLQTSPTQLFDYPGQLNGLAWGAVVRGSEQKLHELLACSPGTISVMNQPCMCGVFIPFHQQESGEELVYPQNRVWLGGQVQGR